MTKSSSRIPFIMCFHCQNRFESQLNYLFFDKEKGYC